MTTKTSTASPKHEPAQPALLSYFNRYLVVFLLTVCILIGAAFAIMQFQTKSQPSGSVQASGRIEGEESHIASLFAGKIASVYVREGDSVKKGQRLLQMDDQMLNPAIESADTGVKQIENVIARAEAQEKAIKDQMNQVGATVKSELAKSQTTINQIKSQAVISQAASPTLPENFQQSQASATENKKGSKIGHIITAPLRLVTKPVQMLNPANGMKKELAEAQEKSMKMQMAMQAKAAKMQAQMQANAATMQVQMQAKAAKEQAKMAMRSMSLMLNQAGTQVVAARAELSKAKALREQLNKKKTQFEISSPIDGVCTTSTAQPGDVVNAGRTLMTIRDPQKVYMRAFVPEGQIAAVKIGQRAMVKLDSGERTSIALNAHVSSIDSAPSFTPENVYFKDDRVRQVFGVKLRIDKPDGSAKPGMPCDAEIFTRETQK